MVVTMHCKSGESFKKIAQVELSEMVSHFLSIAKVTGCKACIFTGDVNWASVKLEAERLARWHAEQG